MKFILAILPVLLYLGTTETQAGWHLPASLALLALVAVAVAVQFNEFINRPIAAQDEHRDEAI